MKAIDTNVLAQFFIDDADDAQAVKQRPAASLAMTGTIYFSVTVLLAFEWLMRRFIRCHAREVRPLLLALRTVKLCDRFVMRCPRLNTIDQLHTQHA